MSATSYPVLEQLIRRGIPEGDDPDLLCTRLLFESRAIKKKMSLLPTARELEALPELKLLEELSAVLLSDAFRKAEAQLAASDKIERAIFDDVFGAVCNDFFKTRIYTNPALVTTGVQIATNLVEFCTARLDACRPLIFGLLNNILDKNQEFYKNNGREANVANWAFGELSQVDQSNAKFVDSLKKGDLIDCVRTISNKQLWTRAVFDSHDGTYTRVRFLGEGSYAYIINPDFDIRPFGTKSIDYDWREGLNVGDFVDYYNYKTGWVLAKVEHAYSEETVVNESVRMIEIRRENLGAGKAAAIPTTDTRAGYNNYFDDFNVTMKVRAHNPVIARPNTQSNRHSSQVDDSQDAMYLCIEKRPRWAILRPSSLLGPASVYFVKFVNLFGARGGFDFLTSAIQGAKAQNPDAFTEAVFLIKNVAESLVQPFVQQHGQALLQALVDFANGNIEKNIRFYSQLYLSNFIDAVAALSLRVYPYQQANTINLGLVITIGVICLKSDILEKQFFGAKTILNYEYHFREAGFEYLKTRLADELTKEGVLEKIVKGHPGLIAKSSGIFKVMIQEKRLNDESLEMIWGQILKADAESRAALLTLLREISGDFSLEHINRFLKLMSENLEDVTSDLLDLVKNLKRIGYQKHDDLEVASMASRVLWKMIQTSKDIKGDVLKEVMKTFVEYVKHTQMEVYVPLIVEGFKAGNNKGRNLKLLIKFLKVRDLASHCLDISQFIDTEFVDKCVQELGGKVEALARLRSSNSSSRAAPTQDAKTSTAEVITQTPAEITLDVKRLIKFLKNFVFPKVSVEKELFLFGHFERIYDVMSANSFIEKQVQDFLVHYLKQPRDGLFLESMKKFFLARIGQIDEDGSEEFLPFLIVSFRAINLAEGKLSEITVRFEPLYGVSKGSHKMYLVCTQNADTFFGVDKIWDLFNKTSRRGLYNELAKLLGKLYLPPENVEVGNPSVYFTQKQTLLATAIQTFKQGTALAAQKASLLLFEIIRKEENQERPVVVSMAQLKDGDVINLSFDRDNKYLKDKIKIKVAEQTTLFDLRQMIEKETRISVKRMTLIRENGERLSSYDNIMTLDMMNIRDNATLVVEQSEVPQVHIDLLNAEGTDFSPQVKLVWKEVFEEHSQGGLMSPEAFAEFTKIVTDDAPCSPEEERVRQVFRTYDPSGTGFLDFDAFMNFYRDCATSWPEKSVIVKKNLQALGYGKEFKLKRPPVASTVERIRTSTRQRLANDPELYGLILKFLKNSNARAVGCEYVLFLFSMLPPSLSMIGQAIEDPLAFVTNVDNLAELGLKLAVLNGLVFRSEFKLFARQAGFEWQADEQEAFTQKLLKKEVFKAICDDIRACLASSPDAVAHPGLVPAVGLLGKFLKGIVALQSPDFLELIKSIPTYISRQKKKNAEKGAADGQSNGADKEKGQKAAEIEAPDREVGEISDAKSILIHLRLEAELVNSIDFTYLNETLLSVLNALNKDSIEYLKSNRLLLKVAATVLATSVKVQPSALVPLLSTESFTETMVEGLRHPLVLFKIFYTNLYALLSSQFEDPKAKIGFLKTLISNLKARADDEFSGLVELACSILAEIGEIKSTNAQFADFVHRELNFMTLFNDFQAQFLAHQSTEQMFSETEDQLLISYLAFLENILNADDVVLEQLGLETKKMLIHQVFHGCLFQVQNGAIDFTQVKCHTRKSRGLAFALLRRLLKDNIRLNIHFLVLEMGPLIKVIPNMFAGTAVQTEYDKKYANGYLGIRNLGCVCYMIATLQQFYCTPAFRYGVLMGQDGVPENKTQVKGAQIDDNFFHQFQKMLSYLDFSERRDFSPFDFCLSYKDYSGQPLNVMIQQDADEFLKILVEKIETSLKNSPFLGILKSVILGKVCNVIKCKGCGYVKTNEEDFFNLSLEVKGMHNTSESFDKLVEPETISDYTCDSCKKKCDISKRALLRSLPNVLFLSLKKMYFDLELLANVKIHSRYEFPMTMNLKKYMYVPEAEPQGEAGAEGNGAPPKPQETQLQDADFDYKLVGVVIHRGNAEYGHYTSLINGNRGDPARKDISTDRWYEFDDSRVSWFDLRKFDEECFGTNEDKDFGIASLGEATTSKSAYLLVYDKVKKNDLVFTFKEDQVKERELLLSNLADPKDVKIVGSEIHTGFYNLKQYIPEPYRTEIWNDNKMLIMEQHLLSKSFTQTMADIFNQIPLNISPNSAAPQAQGGRQLVPANPNEEKVYAEVLLQTLPSLLAKVYCVSAESDRFIQVVQAINKAISYLSALKGTDPVKNAAIDHRLFTFYREQICANYTQIMNAIAHTTDAYVSSGLTEYLVTVTAQMIRHFNITKLAAAAPEDISYQNKMSSLIYEMTLSLGCHLTQTDTSSASIRKSAKVFVVADRFSVECPLILGFFAANNLLGSLSELYMKIECSRINPAEKTLAPMLRLISELYARVSFAAAGNPDFQAYLKKFFKADIVAKAMKEDYKFENFESLKKLAFAVCLGDKGTSEEVISTALNNISGLGETEILGSLEVIRALLHIEDAFQQRRIRLALGVPRLAVATLYDRGAQKTLTFGLSKDYSLKKPVWSYLSPFGQERGILEQIVYYRENYENSVIVLMNYLVNFMLTIKPVFDYVLYLPPHNYVSGCFFDWFMVYLDHHLKYDSSAYSSVRSEAFTKRITETPEKLYALANQVKQLTISEALRTGEKKLFATGSNPYVNYSSYYMMDRNSQDQQELWSVRQNYIIGRTLGYRVLKHVDLETDDDDGAFSLTFTLVRLAMMPSKPTGQNNLSIPQAALLSDLSLTTHGVQNKEFLDFIGAINAPGAAEDDRMELEPIFGDKENDPLGVKKDKPAKERKSEAGVKLAEDSAFLNVDYLVRITADNFTNHNYFLKLLVHGSTANNFNEEEVIVPVKYNSRETTVHLVHLNQIEQTFAGLTASVAWKRTQNPLLRLYVDDYPNGVHEVFKFEAS
jgi:ubiquitin C-terminal hydrolase